MIKTVLSDKIMSFLKQDLIQNLNIIGIIENTEKLEYYVDNVDNPKGVLVHKDYFNYIYANEESFIEDIAENYFKDDYYGFSGLSSFVEEKLRPYFTVQWESPCELYYLPEGALDIALKKRKTVEIDIKDAETVDINYAYRGGGSLDRIKDDISNRPTSAIYDDEEIACWVLVHQDNSMGIMYTMEQHRGKGYAVDVTIDLCDKLIKNGKIPFLQINIHNNMSPGLAAKCGFVKYGRGNWFGGFKGVPKYFKERFEYIYTQVRNDFGNNEIYDKFISSGGQQDYILPTFEMKELSLDSSLELKEVSIDSLDSVGSAEELTEWVKLASKGYMSDDTDSSKFEDLLYSSISKNRDNYKLIFALRDKFPVSAIGVYVQAHETSGICYLSSLLEENDKTSEAAFLALMNYLKENDMGDLLYRAPLKFENLLLRLGAIKL